MGLRSGGLSQLIREAERRNTAVGAPEPQVRDGMRKRSFFHTSAFLMKRLSVPSDNMVHGHSQNRAHLASVSSRDEQHQPASGDPLLYFKTRNGRSSLRGKLPPI